MGIHGVESVCRGIERDAWFPGGAWIQNNVGPPVSGAKLPILISIGGTTIVEVNVACRG
jgi:hypothetical protein